MQDGAVELASSSDEDDAAHPSADLSAADGSIGGNDGIAKPAAQRKRHRLDEPSDDPDQATSVRVRHNDHQQLAARSAATAPTATATTAIAPTAAAASSADFPAYADSVRPSSAAPSAAEPKKLQARPISHLVAHATQRVPASIAAGQAASNSSAQQARAASNAPRPSALQAASGSVPAESASSQQGDCIAPDGTFVGRAAAAGLPPNIMRQTRAALGLWEQLHETASTPSTVLAPVNRHGAAVRTVSVGTDNSAA